MENIKESTVFSTTESLKKSKITSLENLKEDSNSTSIIDGNVSSNISELNTSDSTNTKAVRDNNPITALESSEQSVKLAEKRENEKVEDTSLLPTIGTTQNIGIPLARSSPISREFLALQKSLNDSKILSEFVTDTSAIKTARKGRKSGYTQFNSGSRENSSIKNSNRNRGDPLDISNEDRASAKRANMRSQNSEFAQKHMDFLSRVIQQQQSGDEQYASENEEIDQYPISNADDDDERHTNVSISSAVSSDLALHDAMSLETRLKDVWQPPSKRGWDSFCWRCRECAGSILIPCSKCLRCFHKHCIKVSSTTKLDNSWNCPECLAVENLLSSPKKSRRPELTLEMLSELLIFALKRMRSLKGSSMFIFSDADLSDFKKFIVNPVTFTSLEEKIAKKSYRCPEEFYNETKWMVHNAHILTTGMSNNKLIVAAKSVLKVCRQETNEIETCPGCYFNANTRSDWFVDVCAQPHLLLWAKLKGFPYWPAKAMGTGPNAVVNVRFFGKHDRAFVPIKDCFLFSEQDPNTQTGKRSARELADCIKEVELHIKKIAAKVGKFNYAPFKTQYDPAEEPKQLELMMPGVSQYIKRQQAIMVKPSLQYKIVKTADNNLSIIKKGNSSEKTNDDVEMTHDLSENSRRDISKAITYSDALSDSPKHLTSKYEVITKRVSNDNSYKVSTVILKKRKSLTFINNNADGDEKTEGNMEMSTAKISKITNCPPDGVKVSNKSSPVSSSTNIEVNATTTTQNLCKRKLDVVEISSNDENRGSGEKHKAKQSRSEPRLPILAIKAGSSKIIEPTALEVAENFSKSNMSVTIKKISKTNLEGVDSDSSNSTNIKATRNAAQDLIPAQTHGMQSSINEKKSPILPFQTVEVEGVRTSSPPDEANSISPLKTLQTNADKKHEEQSIFRELVPFVEIKQEIISDEEAEVTSSRTQAETSENKISPDECALSSKEFNLVQAQSGTVNNELKLVGIKEETFSDEGVVNAKDTSEVKERAPSNLNHPKNDLPKIVAPIETCNKNIPATKIRVVGDTTIQRVSVRNGVASSTVQNSTGNKNLIFTTESSFSEPSPPNATTNISNPSQGNHSSNRSGGSAFGSLSATAPSDSSNLLTLSSSKAKAGPEIVNQSQPHLVQQQVQLHQNQSQRARKSFPNRSPPIAGTSSFSNISAASSPPTVTSSVGEIKRGYVLKSTSMVSIPADIAAQRNITQNLIPMPPLTAVSKTTPITSSAKNSIASGYSPSSPTASLTGTIAPVAFVSASNNTTCNTGNLQNSTVLISAPDQTSKTSVPPPLAGLSYPNVNTATYSLVAPVQPSVVPISNLSVPCNSASLPNANVDTAGSIATENHFLGDFVTPALANAITEVICRGPPRMARRPNGPLQSDGSTMFPSEAGPVCRTLVQNAHKLTDFFISVMEDTMCDMSNSDEPSLQAKITLLSIELERMKQAHEKEIAELKRTSDLVLCEMRKSMENEKTRIANEIRKQCELERVRCVEEAKRKQWCANCGREAQFYCCWNTSYCDYPCQQQHWGRHATTCAQTRDTSSSTTNSATIGNAQGTLSTASSISTHALNAEVRSKPSTVNTGTGSTNTNIHFRKNVSNSKKEKNTTSLSGTTTIANKNSINITIPQASSVKADALKLPTNTYLRPVVPNIRDSNSNSSSRSSGLNSVAPSRFKVSLPITSPMNTTSPYKIVQRGCTWELLTSSNNTAPTNTINTITASSSGTSLTSISNPQQQQRSATIPNIANKGSGRMKGNVNMNSKANINGNMCTGQM